MESHRSIVWRGEFAVPVMNPEIRSRDLAFLVAAMTERMTGEECRVFYPRRDVFQVRRTIGETRKVNV